MLHGIQSIRMDAKPLGLKPDTCQVLSYSNPRETHASFIKKKH